MTDLDRLHKLDHDTRVFSGYVLTIFDCIQLTLATMTVLYLVKQYFKTK